MEIFAWITDQLTAFLSRAGIEKAGIKVAFESHGLEPLWALLRDTYFSPFVMLFAIPLLLVLGRISPADRPAARVIAVGSSRRAFPGPVQR